MVDVEARFSKEEFIGERVLVGEEYGEYQYNTYEEGFKQARNFGNGCRILGLCPKDNTTKFEM